MTIVQAAASAHPKTLAKASATATFATMAPGTRVTHVQVWAMVHRHRFSVFLTEVPGEVRVRPCLSNRDRQIQFQAQAMMQRLFEEREPGANVCPASTTPASQVSKQTLLDSTLASELTHEP